MRFSLKEISHDGVPRAFHDKFISWAGRVMVTSTKRAMAVATRAAGDEEGDGEGGESDGDAYKEGDGGGDEGGGRRRG
jgi:hypothetical protein